MIKATINGRQEELEQSLSIWAFVKSLPVKSRFVAVAKNGEVVPRERWREADIAEGDVIEVVRMIGGG